jgi:hypothetical protein
MNGFYQFSMWVLPVIAPLLAMTTGNFVVMARSG